MTELKQPEQIIYIVKFSNNMSGTGDGEGAGVGWQSHRLEPRQLREGLPEQEEHCCFNQEHLSRLINEGEERGISQDY